MTEGFWIAIGVAFVVTCAAMCHSNCASRTCSAGKRPRIVDDQCLCVEVPR